jgi:ABC-type Mn2+/Zn2+ transport system permease subunit
MGALLDPWRDPLMQRALIEVVLLGIVGGTLGTWIVLQRLSFSAEALPHAMFPGLVGAALLGLPLVLGGAAGLVVAAVVIALASRVRGLDRDAAISIAMTALFGLGVLLALSPDSPPGIGELLFGDVLALTTGDLVLAAGLTVVVLGALRVLHARLAIVAFDRESAASLGVGPGRIDLLLLLLVALAVLICVQALGNLFVAAVLVAPAATARLLGRSLVASMAVAVTVAIACGVGGLLLSYHADTAAGASIALVTVVAYLLAAAASRTSASRRAPRPA